MHTFELTSQNIAFLLGFLCRKRVLACSRCGLFNFLFLLAPANCLEIVSQIRDFRGDCLNFWLFMKKTGVVWVILWHLSSNHILIYKILLITRKAFTPLINNKLKLSVISGFTNMVYSKNKKTRKCRKLTQSFVKQRSPIANIWNC